MWLARNFPYFFLVPGILFLAGALFAGYRVVSFKMSAEHAQGTVIKNHSDEGSYHPEVDFITPDGKHHTFVSTTGTSPPSFKAGDRVEVLYDVDAPERGSINSFGEQWLVPLLLSTFGIIFGSVGGMPLIFRRRRSTRNEWLKLNGTPVSAKFDGVKVVTNFEVNGRNPFQVVAQWQNPSTNQVHVFRSEHFWYDPAQYITSDQIRVVIDPSNPKRYWMDLAFLPKLAE